MSGDSISSSSYSRRELLGLVTLAVLSGTISDTEETRLGYGFQTYGRFGFGETNER
jgi:hypothetical protein